MLYVIWFLCGKKVPIRLRLCRVRKKIVLKILSIGCMSFVITILDNLIIIFLNTSLRKYGGNAQGDTLITCATIIQSFMTIVSCTAQGITTGCGTIFSFHYGAENYPKIRQAFFYVFLLCGVYIGALGFAVQYALVDGLTAMGRVKYALPLSLFRKVVYM